MKRIHILAVGVALSAACALPVWAAEEGETVGEEVNDAAHSTGHAIKKGAEATGHAVKKGAEATGHAVKTGVQKTAEFLHITSSEAARYEANERAEHRMYGKVTRINHKSGVVDVKTADAALELQFPPKEVRELNKGDKITVELAYAMADTATSDKAYDAPKEHARASKQFENGHWLKGTVQTVDPSTGIVSLQTEEPRTLTLHFAPSDVANLTPGEHIAVQMGFAKGRHIEKAPPQG